LIEFIIINIHIFYNYYLKKNNIIISKMVVYNNNSIIIQNNYDEYSLLLQKNGIEIDKWYHKLLTNQYYDINGNILFSDDEKIENFRNEYQKSYKLKNISSLVFTKNQLLLYKTDMEILNLFLNGKIYNDKNIPLVNEYKSLSELSKIIINNE